MSRRFRLATQLEPQDPEKTNDQILQILRGIIPEEDIDNSQYKRLQVKLGGRDVEFYVFGRGSRFQTNTPPTVTIEFYWDKQNIGPHHDSLGEKRSLQKGTMSFLNQLKDISRKILDVGICIYAVGTSDSRDRIYKKALGLGTTYDAGKYCPKVASRLATSFERHIYEAIVR